MSDDRAPSDERHREEPDLPEQLRIRRAKYDRLLEAGIVPYPVAVERTTSLANVRGRYPNLAADSTTGEIVGITGRVIF
ncbi:MAG: lysS, partial [Pseudonocardiales bacterium]|nr:lysS [Pseudonocardiales bacterium]